MLIKLTVAGLGEAGSKYFPDPKTYRLDTTKQKYTAGIDLGKMSDGKLQEYVDKRVIDLYGFGIPMTRYSRDYAIEAVAEQCRRYNSDWLRIDFE